MPVLFTCPHCGMRTNVSEPYVGQTGPCVACGKMVTIPSPSGADDSSPPGQTLQLPEGIWIVAAVVACVVIFSMLLLPARSSCSDAARRSMCVNFLKQIGLSMHNYHEVYGCFPAPYTADASGRPLLSWRVAVLPFLEHQDLYKQFHQDEAWDGPHNQAFEEMLSSTFHCPSDVSNRVEASYVLVTGPGGLFPDPSKPRTFQEIPDGTSNTILAVETVGLGIPWAAPRDITVEEFLERFRKAKESGAEGLSRHSGGFNVTMCDSSIRFLPYTTPIETVRALLTPDGGETISEF